MTMVSNHIPNCECRVFCSPTKPVRRDSLWRNPPPILKTAGFQGDTNNLAPRALYTGDTLRGAATSKPFDIQRKQKYNGYNVRDGLSAQEKRSTFTLC